jgi:hypothetical protein
MGIQRQLVAENYLSLYSLLDFPLAQAFGGVGLGAGKEHRWRCSGIAG